MTGYLLDTNVVSELTRPRPSAAVASWLTSVDDSFLSVLTIGELERGVWLLNQRDEVRATRIAEWLQRLRAEYADRILPVDLAVVAAWAARPASRPLPVVDSLLAATAAAHGLTLATRNVADFHDSGVVVVNPFGQS